MARSLEEAPLLARLGEHFFVAAVERQDHPVVGAADRALRERRGVDAGDEHAQGRAVGVFLAGGQIDRLRLRLAVARRAVRQEAFVRIGPQPLVQRLDLFLRGRLNGGAQAVRQRVLEECPAAPDRFRRRSR